MIPEHLRRHRFSARSLNATYPLPNENRTREDWLRARHLDLPALDAEEMLHERRRVMSRLDYELDTGTTWWLRQRLDAIDQERRRRQVAPQRSGAPVRPSRTTEPSTAAPTSPGLSVRRGGRETSL